MIEIEPFINWRSLYIAAEDERSPFYRHVNSEVYFTHTVYNYFIHPQWDEMGSSTLYVKVLFTDYEQAYAIVELMGEWNDVLHNDVMFFYRNVIEPMIQEGIRHFVLIGENILNFHAGDSDYYEEWSAQLDEGWVVCLNFRNHVMDEFIRYNLDYYLGFGGSFEAFNWRALLPDQIFSKINEQMTKRLSY